MAVDTVGQWTFSSGEWAPQLNARVDLQKYQAAVALGLNFFVDYRGGLSSRMGTRYILQAYKSDKAVRLIPFQASFEIGYVLEFGDFYIRFYSDGAPVLETGFSITAISKANPGQITAAGNNFGVGEWVYVSTVVGMTQINGRYFRVGSAGNTFNLQDLNGNNLDTSAYSTYTSGGLVQRVYTLPSPYAAADLATLKYAQSVDQMVICGENYPPYILTLNDADNWLLAPAVFGASITAPGGITITTTLGAGSVNYAYTVTAVDSGGQESAAGTPGTLANKLDLRTTAGTNNIAWTNPPGGVVFNVYKGELSYIGSVPQNQLFGFIGTATTTPFVDSNIDPDYSQTPPLPLNPFIPSSSVVSYTVTTPGAYTSVPLLTVAAPTSGIQARATAVLGVLGTPTVGAGGSGFSIGDLLQFPNGVILGVATVGVGGVITTFASMIVPGTNSGSLTSGATPSNPVTSTSHPTVTANLGWGLVGAIPVAVGVGYSAAPAVTISGGGGGAITAVIGASNMNNPKVPAFFQQRLVLANKISAPQSFWMSKPGAYYNFDYSSPAQPTDSIEGTLVSGQLNEIKAMIPQQSGLIILTSRAAWQVYGSSPGSPVSAIDITAQPQAFIGASDVPPIVANNDILYVQAKGSSIRNVAFNFYTNAFIGTDISVLSSHLFYGYVVQEWAWAEEPFKVVWAIRNDGTALSLTFLKEQELIGWTHSETEGLFKSVTTITEQLSNDQSVDAVYFVVERDFGAGTVKYIERMADRVFTNYIDPWCVDSGLQYAGAPATSFTGAEHLAGMTVTGLADGVPITPFVMPSTGFFTLTTPASVVTIGLAYTCDFQTLPPEVGSPTIQSKMKKIPEVTVRVFDTLGLQIGTTFDNLVTMKDLILGNVGQNTNEVVTDLVTADATSIIDPKWSETGQYCIRQSNPWPATILGVIPQIAVGDTKNERQR